MTRPEPRNFRVRISKPNQLTVTFSIVTVNSSDCVDIRSSPHFCIIILVPVWGPNYHGMNSVNQIHSSSECGNHKMFRPKPSPFSWSSRVTAHAQYMPIKSACKETGRTRISDSFYSDCVRFSSASLAKCKIPLLTTTLRIWYFYNQRNFMNLHQTFNQDLPFNSLNVNKN